MSSNLWMAIFAYNSLSTLIPLTHTTLLSFDNSIHWHKSVPWSYQWIIVHSTPFPSPSPRTSPFSLTKILQRYSKKFAKKIDRTFLPFSIQPSSDGTDSGWNDYFKFVSISFCRELKFSRRYKITLWMNSAAELLWSSFIQLDARETKKNRFFLWNFLPSGNLLERLGNISEDGQLVDSCRKKKVTSFSLFLFLSLRINRRSLHDKSRVRLGEYRLFFF